MILTTKRLVLREFEETDWPEVLAYQSDPLYLRYYHWTHRTEQDVREFVSMFISWREAQPRTRFQWAITLAHDGRLIGNCGIRMERPEAREADIGYELDPRYWSQGYATEAARTLLAFGFRDLHVHRIWSWCIAENAGSARVLERIGMRWEGRLRQKEWIKGRWRDTLLYGVLEHEWQAEPHIPSLTAPPNHLS